MKKYNTLLTLLIIVFGLFSCEKFLDTMPDDRAEVNNEEKITNLLVSAYSSYHSLMMTEMSSDNVMDNGTAFSFNYPEQEDAYLWKDITETRYDCPKSVWDGYYKAIASANQAFHHAATSTS